MYMQSSSIPTHSASVEEKVYTVQQKASSIMYLAKLKPHTHVSCKFNRMFLNEAALIYIPVMCWDRHLKKRGCALQQNGPPGFPGHW
jgi:hypothetical protein